MLDNIMNILFGKNNRNNLFNFQNRNRYRNNRYIYNLVPFEQAKSMIEKKEVIILDVRTR